MFLSCLSSHLCLFTINKRENPSQKHVLSPLTCNFGYLDKAIKCWVNCMQYRPSALAISSEACTSYRKVSEKANAQINAKCCVLCPRFCPEQRWCCSFLCIQEQKGGRHQCQQVAEPHALVRSRWDGKVVIDVCDLNDVKLEKSHSIIANRQRPNTKWFCGGQVTFCVGNATIFLCLILIVDLWVN